MAIDYRHKDYDKHADKWKLIEAVCSGDDVEEYLIELNPNDKTTENTTRNAQYRKRAIFYQVAGYTVRGLNGLLFSKVPKVTLPKSLEYLLTNADGAGVSVYQQAQAVAGNQIKQGRAGLFVTYPETKGAVSKADLQALRVFATIHHIQPDQIINWRTTSDGAQIKLSLVVIAEMEAELQADGYKVDYVEQIRELALENGIFIVRKWRKNAKKEWEVVSEGIPKDGSGKPWSEIPFIFVGAENNSPDIDDEPMQSLAEINIGHYRNSADYEDNVWYCGQSQAYMSGVNQNHIDVMKANNMYVGSRTLLAVPDGGSFGFASADANPLVRQAMLDKLEMMIGLGARFIQPGGAVKTATQATQEASVQHSILSLISSNLSEAYTQCLIWAGKYMNVVDTSISFEATQDFVSPMATAQDIQAMVAGFVQGAIPASAYFAWLKKHGLEDSEKTIEEFMEEVNTEPMTDLDSEVV